MLLYDRGAAAVKAFDTLNRDIKRYDDRYGVPHPGVMYVSAEGVVLAKAAVKGFRDRPAFEWLYAMTVKAIEAGLREGR